MQFLDKIALGSAAGCLALLGMKEIFDRKVSSSIKESNIFKEAMEILEQHKGAIHFLGQPIEAHRANCINSGFLFNETSDVKVKVSGPKSKGVLFISVFKSDDKLHLDSVHLQVGKDDSKRLIVKKSSREKKEVNREI